MVLRYFQYSIYFLIIFTFQNLNKGPAGPAGPPGQPGEDGDKVGIFVFAYNEIFCIFFVG